MYSVQANTEIIPVMSLMMSLLFFISGPGIAGLQNLAVIPGTTIPVAINSTTGVGSWVDADPDCTGMGTGSPFSEYYVDNTSGTYVSYGGFTTVLTALAEVIPCETYHLKLAIADVGDGLLDSGVFIEAGSFTSNSIETSSAGGGGMEWPNTNMVRGCSSGNFTITRTGSTTHPVDVDYLLEGTATNGTDYALLPGTVTIPAGEASVIVEIDPVVLGTLVGTRTVIPKIINPYSCEGDTVIVDTLYIYDSLYTNFSTTDTVICNGSEVQVSVDTDPGFDIEWSASSSLSEDPDAYHVILSPTTSTEYYVSVSVYGSGCDAFTDTVTVDVVHIPALTMADSLELCIGESILVNPEYTAGSTDYPTTFSWTPTDGVSDVAILNPELTPDASGYYFLTLNSGAAGCDRTDSVYLTVHPVLNEHIFDTICMSDLPYTWDGGDVTESGTAVDSIIYSSAVTGCDSIVYLNLYIRPAVETVINENICTGSSYPFFGTDINTAGEYEHTLTSVHGCDSMITLVLTLDPVPNDTIEADICSGSSYDFYGTGYNEAGYYTFLETGTGCDTMRVLSLVVRPVYHEVETYTFCRNDLPHTVHDLEIPVSAGSSAEFATVSFESIYGCDSIITLDITILDTSRTDLDTLLCFGSTMLFGDNEITSGGTYFNILENAAGCDSVIALEVHYTPMSYRTDSLIVECEEAILDDIAYHTDTLITDTFANAIGCDSIYRFTTIRILETREDTAYATICQGDTYSFNGIPYSSDTMVTGSYIMDNGCDSFSTLILEMIPEPEIWLTYMPINGIICVMDTIQITGNGGEHYTFHDFDHQLLGTGMDIDVILPRSQNMFYGIGYDENGCPGKAHLEVMAEPCCDFVMPNAFSPNGDGLNDKFGILTYGNPEDFKLEIYNRWGQRVFVSFKADDQWDGNFDDGKPADMGPYFYTVQGSCYDGSNFFQKGDLTLVR
ncbi:MAG: choice-of-anchor L domain-containing protein [Taibaiella sp.]|nr:choice-of-anchor L domain-containing protein [Taibaiella sp.]